MAGNEEQSAPLEELEKKFFEQPSQFEAQKDALLEALKEQGLKNEVFRFGLTKLIMGAYVPAWMAFTMATVFLCAIGLWALPSNVLVALMTTTFGNVIGLGYIVANYFFPKGGSQAYLKLFKPAGKPAKKKA